MKLIKFFFVLVCSILILNSFGHSSNSYPYKLVIKGNSIIDEKTILSIAEIKNFKSAQLNLEDLNLIQKKLFASGFFSNVEVGFKDNILTINILENPLIDYVIIEGLDKNIDIKTAIEKSINLKSDTIFSESALNRDINLIKDFLSSKGYFGNKVSFEVKKISQNKVNIFVNINLNNEYLVKKIFFIGDKKIPNSKLAGLITTSESNYFNFFNSSSIPSRDRLDQDISLLKNYYLTEGYYDIQISNASINVINENYVNVVFSINAGNKYYINDFNIENNLNFLNKDQFATVKKIVNKYINNHYNYKKINELKGELSAYFDKLSVSVDINYKIIKKSNTQLTVSLNINESVTKKVINNILVVGNSITEEKVIRNNILFAEGDTFFQSYVDRSKDKLLSLNIFNKIDFSQEIIGDKINIKIKVEEKPTGEISSGVGVSTIGVQFSFGLKENNFLGKGIIVDSDINLSTQNTVGRLSFTNPDFFEKGISFTNSAFVTKTDYKNSAYENKIIGDSISISYDIFENIRLENGFSIDYDKIDSASSNSNIIRQQDGSYLTTKYFYNLFNDQRNYKYKPTSGHTVGFGQNFALFPSDIPFIENKFYGSLYKLLAPDYQGTIKYRIKSINSINGDSVKLSDREFLTNYELRGFQNRGIGPSTNGDFIGGNYSFNSTVSTTFPNPIPDSWRAETNIFLDVANVWGSDIDGVSSSNQIRSSIGIGLVWISPLGPIGINYAEPIAQDVNDKVQKFSFTLGRTF